MNLLEIETAYLEHLARRKGRSPNTVKTYRSVFRRAWDITRELGVELDTEAVDEVWADYLVEGFAELAGHGSATIHRNIGALRGLFRYARQQHWTKNDPFVDLGLPDKEHIERVQLSVEQLNALEQATGLLASNVKRSMGRTLFLVQFAIGARVSELLSLTLEDVDLQAGVARIRRGKGGKAREVPLGERAIAALREWLPTRRAWLDTREGDRRVRGAEPPYLWLADRGRRLSSAGLSRYYDELCRLAEIDVTLRTHDLRAMTAQHWTREGVDPDVIQIWLGHSDRATTKIYTRDASPDTRRWSRCCGLPLIAPLTSTDVEASEASDCEHDGCPPSRPVEFATSTSNPQWVEAVSVQGGDTAGRFCDSIPL